MVDASPWPRAEVFSQLSREALQPPHTLRVSEGIPTLRQLHIEQYYEWQAFNGNLYISRQKGPHKNPFDRHRVLPVVARVESRYLSE